MRLWRKVLLAGSPALQKERHTATETVRMPEMPQGDLCCGGRREGIQGDQGEDHGAGNQALCGQKGGYGMIEGTKDDNGKLKLSRVPPELIEAVARVRDFGDRKYTDPENWKHIAPERWHEALLRHVLAIWNDPMHIDEESGLPSLWHVACNAAFLCAQDNEVNPYTFCKAIPFAAIIDG
nr:MAG TPA: hypothetical protein [Caudoviricetes sp.]